MQKRYVQLGATQVDLSTIVRDLRGIEDMVAEAVEKDWNEFRYEGFEQKLYPFADAADIVEWDNYLLTQYPPLYTNPQGTCGDCPLGPCDLEKGAGKCGLELEPYQAKLSLKVACRGCLSQMMDSRELVDYAIKLFGRDKPLGMGILHDTGDAYSIGILTGQIVKKLADLDKALSYAEAQLNKLLVASCSGTGSAADFEELTFHAGSLLFLAMDVAEFVKINCFDFINAGNQKMEDLINFPLANHVSGMGNVDREKPVLVFVGDSFLPGWVAINQLKEKGLIDQVEICGIGPAGDDIARFYDKCRIVGPMTQATKLIRSGFADVIVASTSCIPLDIVVEAKRVDSRLIWIGRDSGMGLRDRIDDPIDEIVNDLSEGKEGVWIRDAEKAGEVAARVIAELKGKRKGDYLISEETAKAEAKKCLPDCDLCFSVCPNSLPISKAIGSMQTEGLKALLEVEKGCYFCGKCEEVCPAKLPLRDMIVAAYTQRAKDDKFVMRAGRGPVSRIETAAYAFPMAWGNSPGMAAIIGCGNASFEDIGWIAHELTSRNFLVLTASCAAAELARHFDQQTQKFVFEKFPSEAMPRNLVNCGGCSACAQIADFSYKYARTGSAISHYANYAETVDIAHNLGILPSIVIWGALPERMYTIAAGLARLGTPVVVGPSSGLDWNRFMLGNKWDWRHWWTLATLSGKKRATDPAPRHMMVPVETKEEAVAMLTILCTRPPGIREARQATLEHYTEMFTKFFGELPDDWHLYVRADGELPMKTKGRLLKELKEKHGWEVERLAIKKVKHPDGRILDMAEFKEEYSAMGTHITHLPRLVTRSARKG